MSLVPKSEVTLLQGDGGTGKSTLALQLAISVACGTSFLGRQTGRGPVLYFSAEDSVDTLHERCSAMASVEALLDLHVLDFSAHDAQIVVADRSTWTVQPTPLLNHVDGLVRQVGAVLLVLDNAADVFGGNENDRVHVRRFFSVLRGLCRSTGVTIILLAHPSRSGMSDGSGQSGSTAWNGSVRQRLYLERVFADGREPDPNLRNLTIKKSNYGPAGGSIGLRWSHGAFELDQSVEASATLGAAVSKFFEMLDRFEAEGREVGPNPGSNFAPRKFAEHPGSGMFTRDAFRSAMDHALSQNMVRIEKVGPPSRQKCVLRRVGRFDPPSNANPQGSIPPSTPHSNAPSNGFKRPSHTPP